MKTAISWSLIFREKPYFINVTFKRGTGDINQADTGSCSNTDILETRVVGREVSNTMYRGSQREEAFMLAGKREEIHWCKQQGIQNKERSEA